jgi:hypothetical protein
MAKCAFMLTATLLLAITMPSVMMFPAPDAGNGGDGGDQQNCATINGVKDNNCEVIVIPPKPGVK